MLSPKEVARLYGEMADTKLPAGLVLPGSEFWIRSLLSSCDPRLDGVLAAIATRSALPWSTVQSQVTEQRESRRKLYAWISELAARLDADPDFVFPDPYSLLCWVRTFQLFDSSLVPPGGNARWFFYRGEEQDYGKTRFMPTAARHGREAATAELAALVRHRKAIVDHPGVRAAVASWLGSIGEHLLQQLSLSQTLAIAQHYGRDTPLLDVTTNPEVAMFFATRRSGEKDGVLGFWRCDKNTDSASLALVLSPIVFERLHRQSACFICSPPDRSPPLAAIRFRHVPELEPMRPRWLAGFGRCTGVDDDILTDPWDLTGILQGINDPHKVGAPLPSGQRPTPDDARLVAVALDAIGTAAGKMGVVDGRRFVEVHPKLVYHLFRYALGQFLTLAKLLQISAIDDRWAFVRPLSGKLVEVLTAIVSAHAAISSPTIDDQILDILTHAGAASDAMPWPVSAWVTQ